MTTPAIALPPPVADHLRRHHVMTLATCSADGPWAAAVFYAHAGHRFYFVSSPRSRHACDLARDPRCAATIQSDGDEWTQVKGVQLEGTVHRLHGDDVHRAREHYGGKFALVARLDRAPAAIVEAFARVGWYCLTAERMVFVDNSRGFGHREAIDLGRAG